MQTLAYGSVGQAVKNAQIALNYHLPNQLPQLAVDGIFGPKTLARVVAFQERYRLNNPPKGVIGPQTNAALYTFVECKHHVVLGPPNLIAQGLRGGVSLGSAFRFDPIGFPPLPPVPIPFPSPFRLIPPLAPPRLDPDMFDLFRMHHIDFELSAGQETSFSSGLHLEDKERKFKLFTELTATVWSKPFGEHVEVSAGTGLAFEKTLRRGEFEASAFIFAKMEVKDILKFGPLDLLKLETEARLQRPFGLGEPPEMSVGASLKPEVSLFHDRLTFGPGGYLGIEGIGNRTRLAAGVSLSGALHF